MATPPGSTTIHDGSIEEEKHLTRTVKDHTSILHTVDLEDATHTRSECNLILGYIFLATLPMIALGLALLVPILSLRVHIKVVGNQSSASHFFVKQLHGNVIQLLGMLSALLAVLLVPVMLRLSSFIYAKNTTECLRTKDSSLLLWILYGSPIAYLIALRRSFQSSSQRQIRIAAVVSTVLLALSLLVILSSMCLVLSTAPLSERYISAAFGGDWGRSLVSDCFSTSTDGHSNDNMTSRRATSTSGCQGRIDLLIGNHQEADATAQKQSTLNKVARLDFPGIHDFHDAAIFILTDSHTPPDSTYSAKTYGVATWFQNIGYNCSLNAANGSYDCPDHHFTGSTNGGLAFPDPKYMRSIGNGIVWFLAAKVFGPENMFDKFENNANYAISVNGSGLLTVFHCETNVYEVEYNKTGAQYVPTSILPTDSETAKLIYSPMFPGMIEGYTGFQTETLYKLFTHSALFANTEDDIARSWAEDFAFLGSASSADILVPDVAEYNIPALSAVPKAPVLVLCAVELLHSLLGWLMLIAVVRSSKAVWNMQARLSIEGLVLRASEP